MRRTPRYAKSAGGGAPVPAPVEMPTSLQKTVITEFASTETFERLLAINPGLVIVSMSTPNCVHCRAIEPIVSAFFASTDSTVVCCELSNITSPDLYRTLFRKRMVVVFPTLLVYARGNVSLIPNDSVAGSDPVQLGLFLERCRAACAILSDHRLSSV